MWEKLFVNYVVNVTMMRDQEARRDGVPVTRPPFKVRHQSVKHPTTQLRFLKGKSLLLIQGNS